jgi:hypothetical protein
MDDPLPFHIDRALSQTAKAGLRYAVLPEPWMAEWFNYIGQHMPPGQVRTQFHWFNYCGHQEHHWDTSKFPVIDGDVYLCLMTRGHEGPCGYASLIESPSGTHPIAEGFEGILTIGNPKHR